MKIRRPLCVMGIIYILLVYIFTGFAPAEPVIDAERLNDKTAIVKGIVDDYVTKNNQIWIYLKEIEIEVYQANAMEHIKIVPRRAGIIAKMDDNSKYMAILRIGERVEVKGVFNAFNLPANEGEFDARHYYKIRGYDGQLKRGRLIRVSAEYNLLKNILREIRDGAVDVLNANMDETNAGILSAMLLGDKSDLDAEIKELYQNSGISHVLALSGLHIASIGLFILRLAKKSGLSIVTSSIISGTVLFMYALLTGLSVSTLRALIMFALAIIADLIGRSYDLLSAAALSAILILIENPYYAYDCGFLLSYGAVVGIGVVYPIICKILSIHMLFIDIKTVLMFGRNRKEKSRKNSTVNKKQRVKKEKLKHNLIFKIISKIGQSICFGLSITVVTLPISAYFFYQISRFGIILNLVVIPLMSVVLFTGFLGIFLCGLGRLNMMHFGVQWMGEKCLKITHAILQLYGASSSVSTGLKGNLWIIGKPSISQCVIYYLILAVIITLWSGKNSKTELKIRRNKTKSVDSIGLMKMSEKPENVTKRDNKITHKTYLAETNIEKGRKALYYRVFAYFIFIIAIVILALKPVSALEVRNLYVGQGDCSLINGKSLPIILIDGGSSDIKQVGKYRILPVLKSNGIDCVDFCFISHMDADHVNGIFEIVENPNCGVTIDTIIISKSCAEDMIKSNSNEKGSPNDFYSRLILAQKNGLVKIRTMSKGSKYCMNGLVLNCLSPGADDAYMGNDSSLVLALSYEDNDGRNLFTAFYGGDISSQVEQDLVEELSPVTMLKVSHHGSRYSTGEAFLNRIAPKVAIISSGKNNSYGHPHKETLQRFKEYTPYSRIYRTDECGQVTMRVDRDSMVIKRFTDIK